MKIFQRSSTIILLLFGVCILPGCRESFTPRGTYQQKLIVYAVLSSRSDTQYVRLSSTYNPPTDNPLSNTVDPEITDAALTISDGVHSFAFHDTTLVRHTTTRYSTPLHAQVAYGFQMNRGSTYSLTVTSQQYGTISSKITTVEQASVRLYNGSALGDPSVNRDVEVRVFLGKNAKGYTVRAYLEFQALVNGQWTQKSKEIPSAGANGTSSPTLFYRGQNIYSGLEGVENVVFPLSEYLIVLSELKTEYNDSLKFSKSRFTVSQLDENLFAYYNVVNGFPDSFTLRVDEPDYTNIIGGLGIFGSVTEDTYTYDLPEKIKIP